MSNKTIKHAGAVQTKPTLVIWGCSDVRYRNGKVYFPPRYYTIHDPSKGEPPLSPTFVAMIHVTRKLPSRSAHALARRCVADPSIIENDPRVVPSRLIKIAKSA